MAGVNGCLSVLNVVIVLIYHLCIYVILFITFVLLLPFRRGRLFQIFLFIL